MRSKFGILFSNGWVGLHICSSATHIKELAWRLAEKGREVHILITRGNKLITKYEEAYRSVTNHHKSKTKNMEGCQF